MVHLQGVSGWKAACGRYVGEFAVTLGSLLFL